MEFTWEPIAHLLNCGINELGRKSWEENWKDSCLDYDPDWPRYQRMEAEGIMRICAARDKNKLVGYAVVIMATDLHDRKVMTAFVQDLYVKSSYNGLQLLRHVIGVLKTLKARQIVLAERLKSSRSTSKIFQYLGFKNKEAIWTLELKV